MSDLGSKILESLHFKQGRLDFSFGTLRHLQEYVECGSRRRPFNETHDRPVSELLVREAPEYFFVERIGRAQKTLENEGRTQQREGVKYAERACFQMALWLPPFDEPDQLPTSLNWSLSVVHGFASRRLGAIEPKDERLGHQGRRRAK